MIAVIIVAGVFVWNRTHRKAGETTASSDTTPQSGGELVATFRSEPKTFNRLVAVATTDQRLSQLTQASLVFVNPLSDALEPRLAREWSPSADGLTWTLKLRHGLLYSDGQPFSSADVTFTFDALYDPRVASSFAHALTINGKPLVVHAVDEDTVSVTFPAPYGPGLRVLSGLPILPRHKLAAALAAGTFRDAWSMTTTPADIAGLGPFAVAQAVPGERVRLVRNPHYWRTDDEGRALPYLDGIDVEIVPQQDAEVLRFESGQSDVMNDFVRPEDVAALRDLEAKGAVRFADAGVTVDPSALWFSLRPDAPAAKDRPWLQREEFRQAVSFAIDRQQIVNTVYLGAAVPIGGPITPGFGDWYAADLPVPPHDPTRARKLLATVGLTDHHGDGQLEDASGAPAHFSLLTQKGNTIRERTAAVIQAELKDVGLTVDVAAVDPGTLVAHVQKGDYDAMYYGPLVGSRDPAENLDFWMSSGGFHLWYLDEPAPATPWEAQIDGLMRRVASSTDQVARHAAFHEVQRIFADHAPALYFAAPKALVATSARLHGVKASVLQPPVLWNAEALWLTPSPKSSR